MTREPPELRREESQTGLAAGAAPSRCVSLGSWQRWPSGAAVSGQQILLPRGAAAPSTLRRRSWLSPGRHHGLRGRGVDAMRIRKRMCPGRLRRQGLFARGRGFLPSAESRPSLGPAGRNLSLGSWKIWARAYWGRVVCWDFRFFNLRWCPGSPVFRAPESRSGWLWRAGCFGGRVWLAGRLAGWPAQQQHNNYTTIT